MELDPFLYHLPKESLREAVQKPPYECPDYLMIDGTFLGKSIDPLPSIYNERAESWMRHPFFKHLIVSNYGRIQRDYTDGSISALLYREDKSMPGYWTVNDGTYDFFVYSLIAETWLLPWNPDPYKYRVVHHIDNNGFINCCWNLIYVTHAQHSYIHNYLPEGWEDMEEEEAMASQKKSLKAWIDKIKSKFTLVDWDTYISLKRNYVKNRISFSPLTQKSFSLFYQNKIK